MSGVVLAPAGTAAQPEIYKTVSANAAGNTVLWTPAAGKRFRLLRYRIALSNDAVIAVAGRITVDLLDGAVSLNLTENIFVAAAANGTFSPNFTGTGWFELGPAGILSAALNNILNVNLSVALTGGLARVWAAGYEEAG